MRFPLRKATAALELTLAGALGCSQEHEARERSDAAAKAVDAAGAQAADAEAATNPEEDGSSPAPFDAGVGHDAEADDADTGSSALDAASSADASDASHLPVGQCHPQVLTATRTVPEMMIVLDRSQSMAPATPLGVNCAGFDIFNATLLCQGGDQAACEQLACTGVDCTAPPYSGTVVCGGTNPSPSVDRWQPAVQGLQRVSEQFQAEINFGLTTFPGQPIGTGGSGPADDVCAAGNVRVPIASNAAEPIAQALFATQPGGATPLGDTLTAVLEHLNARAVPPLPRHLLLLTDGQPTCPNSRGNTLDAQTLAQDHALALQALDALRAADVKTFVLGFVTASEAALAAALGEFAVHGGTDRFYPVRDAQSISDQFAQIAAAVAAPCSFTLDAEHQADTLLVALDAFDVEPNTNDGFVVQGTILTLRGAACDLFRDGREHRLKVSRGCQQ